MSNRGKVQQQVRQRARFTCNICRTDDAGLKQYAHIVPESDGGQYEVDNIIWACEGCQRKYEPANKPEELKKLLIAKMRDFRDKPKSESIAHDIFELISSNKVLIKMGALQFENVLRPFAEQEPIGPGKNQYIEFIQNGMDLVVNGLIKDEYGKPLISFQGSKVEFFTGDIWDFERKARYLKIINQTKKTEITIEQHEDQSIEVKGSLFFDHQKMTISDAIVRYGGLSMRNVGIKNCYIGLRLPFTEWLPVGHMRCRDFS
jgi:HNH endonuclease